MEEVVQIYLKKNLKKPEFKILIFTNHKTKHYTVTVSTHTRWFDRTKKTIKFGNTAWHPVWLFCPLMILVFEMQHEKRPSMRAGVQEGTDHCLHLSLQRDQFLLTGQGGGWCSSWVGPQYRHAILFNGGKVFGGTQESDLVSMKPLQKLLSHADKVLGIIKTELYSNGLDVGCFSAVPCIYKSDLLT